MKLPITLEPIPTLENLLWLSQYTNQWGECFKQTGDIDASGTLNWNPDGTGGYYGFSLIGNNSTAFTGSYNGTGYTISGLYINRGSESNIGLFGFARETAEIGNLGVVNVDISGNNSVGGLAGYYGSAADTIKKTVTRWAPFPGLIVLGDW